MLSAWLEPGSALRDAEKQERVEMKGRLALMKGTIDDNVYPSFE